MKKQKGYTITELLIVFAMIMAAITAVGALYVLGHFIAKFW